MSEIEDLKAQLALRDTEIAGLRHVVELLEWVKVRSTRGMDPMPDAMRSNKDAGRTKTEQVVYDQVINESWVCPACGAIQPKKHQQGCMIHAVLTSKPQLGP